MCQPPKPLALRIFAAGVTPEAGLPVAGLPAVGAAAGVPAVAVPAAAVPAGSFATGRRGEELPPVSLYQVGDL